MKRRITRQVIHAIDDLANEVFLRLAQELGELEIEDPQASLCTTLLEIDKDYRALGQDPLNLNSSVETSAHIEQALQALTADQRDALFLHLGKGMTVVEIAHQTGIPREAVLNDLLRAYSRLRLLLGDDNLQDIR
jgi:hypothetical protein